MADQSPTKPAVDTTNLDAYVNPIQAMVTHEKLVLDIYSMTARKGIAFPALIKSYQDSFSTNLETVTFVGHPEPLRKAKSTERTIAITIAVVAQDVHEAKKNLTNVKHLVQMLYPAMDQKTSMGVKQRYVRVGGDPIFKIRFQNFMVSGESSGKLSSAKRSGLKGYIDGLSYTMDFDSGVFPEGGKAGTGMLYPQNIELSFSYYPFHETAPGWVFNTDEGKTLRQGFSPRSLPYAVGKKEATPKPSSGKKKADPVKNVVNESRNNRVLNNVK